MTNHIQYPQITFIAILTGSARRSADLSAQELQAICEDALQGRTLDEPDASRAAEDIALRGFHIHAGIAWGLVLNTTRSCLELARLIRVADNGDGTVLLGVRPAVEAAGEEKEGDLSQMTLEQLNADAPESDVYTGRAQAKIDEIAAHLAGRLKPELDARLVAAAMFAAAEEQGRIDGDAVNFEVPSRYTIDGRPSVETI